MVSLLPLPSPRCATRGREGQYMTMAIDLTFGHPTGMLTIVKIEFGPALSENSMRMAADSDPEIVKVRNGEALSERIRERLT